MNVSLWRVAQLVAKSMHILVNQNVLSPLVQLTSTPSVKCFHFLGCVFLAAKVQMNSIVHLPKRKDYSCINTPVQYKLCHWLSCFVFSSFMNLFETLKQSYFGTLVPFDRNKGEKILQSFLKANKVPTSRLPPKLNSQINPGYGRVRAMWSLTRKFYTS